MFKLVLLSALVALSSAAPGGLTGHILDHGLGPIHAPNVITHSHPQHVAVIAQPVAHPAPAVHAIHAAPIAVHAVHAPVIAHAEPLHVVAHHQPLAPKVHVAPILTKTVLPGHDHYVPVLHHSHGLH